MAVTSLKRAKYWERLNNSVKCLLCPRECILKDSQTAMCGVRKNESGVLMAMNFGTSLIMCEERIETDGIFHFKPGSRTLALGGLGCSLHCDFCQNWAFARIKENNSRFIRQYSPEQIVEAALNRNIKILSWTYNEPAVWYEFIIETAKLAHNNGLENIFNSSFYVNPEPLKDLINVIDVFAFSLKSLNEDYYKKVCRGTIEPVLNAAKIIKESGRHVEFKNLMVYGLNDNDFEINRLLDWYIENIGTNIPLHFVGAHPDYRFSKSKRTDVAKLEKARKMALDMGIKYSYIGNVFSSEGMNTYCPKCRQLLIERMGIGNTSIIGIKNNHCINCATSVEFPIIKEDEKGENTLTNKTDFKKSIEYNWKANYSVHLELSSNNHKEQIIECAHIDKDNHIISKTLFKIDKKDSFRQMVAKLLENEKRITISYNNADIKIFEVNDRAQYPFNSIDDF